MNRRGFLKMLGAVAGGIALNEAIPLNRVWSFPSKIVVPDTLLKVGDIITIAQSNQLLAFEIVAREYTEALRKNLLKLPSRPQRYTITNVITGDGTRLNAHFASR